MKLYDTLAILLQLDAIPDPTAFRSSSRPGSGAAGLPRRVRNRPGALPGAACKPSTVCVAGKRMTVPRFGRDSGGARIAAVAPNGRPGTMSRAGHYRGAVQHQLLHCARIGRFLPRLRAAPSGAVLFYYV